MRRSTLLFEKDNCPTQAFKAFLHDVQVPGEDLASIDHALQARFFQKGPDGQPLERWELKELQMGGTSEKVRRHLRLCGFIADTIPSQWQYTRAAWPGALVVRAAARLFDLISAWESGVRWEETVVFGGKRPLQPDKENYVMCCAAMEYNDAAYSLKKAWEGINPRTELDLMRWLWEVASLSDALRALPIVFVDAPMKPSAKEGGEPVRPNTEDTVQEWLRGKPQPGPILLSSGAPYGMAQDEAFWMLLEPHGHTVETFGHAAPKLPIESYMREVAGAVNRIRKARKP